MVKNVFAATKNDNMQLFAALALRFHALYLADVVHACRPQSCDLGVAFDRAGVIRKARALGEFNGMDGTRI